VIIPDPQGLDWDRWAATVVGFNPELASHVHPNMGWESFAMYFADDVSSAPLPAGFETWQDWARALKLAVQS
jgi:hypothetical protein